jgi:hypothetical protein
VGALRTLAGPRGDTLPPVIVWAIGTVSAAVVAKLVVREWRRVNAELDRVRKASVAERERAARTTLSRDPATGVYRPQR